MRSRILSKPFGPKKINGTPMFQVVCQIANIRYGPSSGVENTSGNMELYGMSFLRNVRKFRWMLGIITLVGMKQR